MFIPGYRRSRSGDAQLDRIERGVRIIMSQLEELIGILQAVDGDVSSLLTKASSLESQLQSLQANTPDDVDLGPALELAKGIRQHLEGTASTTSEAISTTASAGGSDSAGESTGSTDTNLGNSPGSSSTPEFSTDMSSGSSDSETSSDDASIADRSTDESDAAIGEPDGEPSADSPSI